MNKLRDLLGALRALDWHYKTGHWQVGGQAQYGDHLLFERLYSNLEEEIDALAEKMVGLFGFDSVNAIQQMKRSSFYLWKWTKFDCAFKIALFAERDIQTVIKQSYDEIRDQGNMTLGLDDFLMSLASDHEVNLYLLQQRLQTLMHLNKKEAFTSLEKSWSGGSTFSPMRNSEVEEDCSSKRDLDTLKMNEDLRWGLNQRTEARLASWTKMKTAKLVPSSVIPGLSYETSNHSFKAIKEVGGNAILSYPDKVLHPEEMIRLSDRIFREVDWSQEDTELDKERVRQLVRQFHRSIELKEDKNGNPSYRVREGVL